MLFKKEASNKKTSIFRISFTIFKGIPAFEPRILEILKCTQITRLEVQIPYV